MSLTKSTDKHNFVKGIYSKDAGGSNAQLKIALTDGETQVDSTGVFLDFTGSTDGAVLPLVIGAASSLKTPAVTSTAASNSITVATGTSTPATAITGGATGALTARTGASVANHASATGGATGAASFGSGNATSTLGTSGASGAATFSSGTSEDAATGAVVVASGASTGGTSGSGAATLESGTVVGTAASGAIAIRSGAVTAGTAISAGASGGIAIVSGATDTTDAGATGAGSGAFTAGTGHASSTAGAASGPSGLVTIRSGNSADDVSGDIDLTVGTAGTTRGDINLSATNLVMAAVMVNHRLVSVTIDAVGGSGGATAGTMAVDVKTLDGAALADNKRIIIKASLTAVNPQALVSTVTFATATKGTIIATGNGYVIADTDGAGEFDCAVSDSADETVFFWAESLPGVTNAGDGCVVVECVADTAVWSA